MNPAELQEYENNPKKFMFRWSFLRVKSGILNNEETEGEKEKIAHLIDCSIDVLTIRDGKQKS